MIIRAVELVGENDTAVVTTIFDPATLRVGVDITHLKDSLHVHADVRTLRAFCDALEASCIEYEKLAGIRHNNRASVIARLRRFLPR